MQQNKHNKKSSKLFWVISSAILFAAFLWFVMIPIIFNSGSSFLKNVLLKKEVPFEVFSPEAFAYDLGGSWEVNASARVKGFDQKADESGKYSASISFTIDLLKPDGERINSVFENVVDNTNNEEMMDIALDGQFDLDSTYAEGKYKVIFNVKDVNSDKSGIAEAEFELTK